MCRLGWALSRDLWFSSGYLKPTPDKRGYRKLEVLVRDLSGNPTNQELATSLLYLCD
jgi:hypothetical protein